jgi:hypothetical protein
MRQFVGRLRRSRKPGESLHLAFHGTRQANFASIFRRGFLLPGWGRNRAPVENGNAHGPGIYTAREGGAELSRGFCDSASMLVCAVIDDAGVEEEEGRDPEAAARTILRIGRPPRCPSTCVRLRPDGAPASPPRGGVLPRPAFLGTHQVLRRTSEVLHVGDAMVVFNPACVAPLFRVDRVPRQLYRSDWAEGAAALCPEAQAYRPCLDGRWFASSAEAFPTIEGDKVKWEDGDTWAIEAEGGDLFSTTVNGMKYSAQLVGGQLRWDGGDTWTRLSAEPPRAARPPRATRHELAVKRNAVRRQRLRRIRDARDLKRGGH